MYLVGSLSAAPITLLESDLSVAKSISNYVRAPLLACCLIDCRRAAHPAALALLPLLAQCLMGAAA